MLVKRKAGGPLRQNLAETLAAVTGGSVSRRAFLERSGLAAGGLAAVASLPRAMVRKAEAGPVRADVTTEVRKNVCVHCSVGCTVIAEVQNGVWVGQEPGWDSPISQGTHCAKGAAVRELTKGERRVKYPMKLVAASGSGSAGTRRSRRSATQLQQIRQESGPELGLLARLGQVHERGLLPVPQARRLLGHEQRRPPGAHLPLDDRRGRGQHLGLRRDDELLQRHPELEVHRHHRRQPGPGAPGLDAAHARGKERNKAPFIVVDPRFTRTAAHATEFVRIRAGTDIPIIYGLLWHIFENGWEDKEYIHQRVYGMDEIRAEAKKYPPNVVEDITGAPGDQIRRIAEAMVKNKPATLIWCMGATQKTVGTANVRAFSILQLALGNIGVAGGGANIYRGHTNVQGATDMGLDVTSLPSYYGLDEGAWRHWSRVWDVPYDSMKARFASKELMERKGIPTTRWFDAVLAKPGELDQPNPFRGMVVFGHGGNTVTRMPEMLKGLEQLKLLVIADPVPTAFSAFPTGATTPTACRSAPRSRARAPAPRRTARCSGASGSSTRSSSRRTTTRRCT